MKNKKTILFLLVILTSTVIRIFARENNIGSSGMRQKEVENVMSGCVAGTSRDVLDLNNVRTTILTSGDMWWDLVSAKYEVPKGGGASSIFAGSLWIGGIDGGGQLKVSAMTYRQSGVDFWPGPLDTTNTSISSSECSAYDKHYVITLAEVQNYVNGTGTLTPAIQNWPGNGHTALGEASHLAPFFDRNGDGFYDPQPNAGGGDYPLFSLNPAHPLSCNTPQLFGDKTMWGVFNDEGNIHTESKGAAIGLEIRYQAFAYTTNDAINNATFYDYQIINRSTESLYKTYFGVWVDFDLGYYQDDYTGCDVANGLGYGYNGLAVDGTGAVGQYGANPPCVGVDFFRGPHVSTGPGATPNDGIDQNGISFVDPATGRIGMAKFVYYNNDFTPQGNPTKAQDYYNYLTGFWIDGTPFTYGGNAYKGSGPQCDFMFPGTSDPTGLGTGLNGQPQPQPAWSEVTAHDAPGDRRFMESAGPFTLQVGAVNSVTTGVVWGRATQGGNLASIPVMQDADVLAQALFNNCFAIANGPDAPDMTIQELNDELIIYLTNKTSSNNYKETYKEKDAYISHNHTDSLYKFEGYQVFQISDSSVSAADVYNPSKARLVFQCDIKNNQVTKIINYYKDQVLGWVPQLMVSGTDSGITHSFVVKTDAFSTGSPNLVNQKQYYFLAIAYGYNPGEAYPDPNSNVGAVFTDGYTGVKDGYNLPYIASRRNVHYAVGMPHIPSPEYGGTMLNSGYGNGVQLTRLEGQGNGGRILQLTGKSDTLIQNSGVYSKTNPNGARVANITYDRGVGPINIMVIDPLSVPPGNFQISISDSSAKARWVLTNMTTGVKIKSDTTLQVGNQQIIPELGLSITASYTTDIAAINSGIETAPNGILASSMTFGDPTKQWLSGLPDMDTHDAPAAYEDWIRSGVFIAPAGSPAENPFGDYVGYDNSQYFQKVLGGTWAPYEMCAYTDENKISIAGPAFYAGAISSKGAPLTPPLTIPSSTMGRTLASVDVVFTSNPGPNNMYWTRCPVLEMQESPLLAQGGASKLSLRRAASVDRFGHSGTGSSTDPNSPNYIESTGMGWFPGYAINIETGERLNMAFGEDSGLPTENGRDMVWNPTSDVFDATGINPIFGGKHYIYVFAHVADQTISSSDFPGGIGPRNIPRYDGGLAAWELLTAAVSANNVTYQKLLFADAMWVNIPLLAQGHKLLETTATVQIRVPRIFRKGFSGFFGAKSSTDAKVLDTTATPQNKNWPLYSFTTNDLQVQKGLVSVAKSALDLINIVPNPYYAYSGYEVSQVDHRVRITNLPPTSTIRIFTLNGTLIRTINKADPSTYADWDLNNQAGIQIASGLYLIHVNAPGVGEKILKWFGVIRPADLNTF